jgi:putative oxidoreductase
MRNDIGLLLLRLAGLGLALAHGWGKVEALSTGHADGFVRAVAELGFPLPLFFSWASALAEFLGGILVALGLGTRIAAGLVAVNMAVAAFRRHHALARFAASVGLVSVAPDTLKGWGNPELALIYLVVSLTIVLLGPGRLALDPLVRRRR